MLLCPTRHVAYARVKVFGLASRAFRPDLPHTNEMLHSDDARDAKPVRGAHHWSPLLGFVRSHESGGSHTTPSLSNSALGGVVRWHATAWIHL